MDGENSILDWIGFGKVSAERDDLLSEYFFDNGVLRAVIASPSSFLILGRKGAGKTAVFRYLTDNFSKFIAPVDLLVSLSFEDYNWSIHALLQDQSKAKSMLYRQSWRFVILVECVKAYKGWFDARQMKLPRKLYQAGTLLERLFDTPIPSMGQLIGKKILSLSKLKLPSVGLDVTSSEPSLGLEGGEVSFEQVQESPDLRRQLSENIENVILLLDDAIADADSSWPAIYICFDRVDEAWDDVSYESSRSVIAGLVTACNSINSQYKGRLRPILFLREDIFEVLSINDLNKLRTDCGKLLHWDFPSLSRMILQRVNYFARKHGAKQVNDVNELFDRAMMRQGTPPSKYILRQTMMRPRDLIALLDGVVVTMKEKVSDPFVDKMPTFAKLECESIYAAAAAYSEWLKQELLDEWKTQRPEITELFTAIQNNGSTNVTHDTLNKQLERLGKKMSTAELTEALRFLFNNSIIGFKLGSSTEWRFKCFYPSQGFVVSPEYRVHQGLVRTLNLTEPRAA